MKKSFYSHFFILSILVAFVCSFNIYAQDNSTGPIPIPEKYGNKIHTQFGDNSNTQYNFDDFLASTSYAYCAQDGLMHDIWLPSGTVGNMPPWGTATAWPSGMTRDPSLAPNSYWIVDTGDSVWQFDQNTGLVTYWGTFFAGTAVGANGWAFNPADGMFYLATSTDLWVMPPPPPVPGPITPPTLIGPFNTGGLMIDLCFDNVNIGLCYGYDIGTDAAYTINIFTGNAAIIGPLGYNANYGQGMGHDYERGWIYLTAFDVGAFDGQLRVLDPETGQTTVLASLGLNQMDPFSPQTDPMLILPGPGRAIAPSPFNGYTNVPGVPNVTLTWANPVGTTANDVYFGTDFNSLSLVYSGAPITSWPVTVNYSTTYYWYVDCSAVGNTPGTLWSFTTEGAPCPVFTPPVTEDFESGVFPPLCWSQTGVIWGSGAASGYGNGSYSAKADFYGVSSGFDDLISFEFDVSAATTPTLTFDWAYATYIDDPDQLDIYYSTDTGITWTLLLAIPGGLNGPLNPYHLATTSAYTPLAADWSTMSLPLPGNADMVSFTATTAYGNNLFVDNITVSGELFFDDFEDPPYTFPGMVACQNSAWTVWSGVPCGNDDATISTNYAKSGTQSALIDFVAPRDVDLVKLFDTSPKTSGKWYISFAFYIPEAKAGYFNTMNTYQVDWGHETYFNSDATGFIDNGVVVPFVYLQDHWNQCMVVVDLNTSIAEFWVGPGVMTQVAVWDWTRGGTYPNTLDANDFFGATTSDEMYIDDYRFSDAPPPILQLANDVGTESIDLATQVAPGTVTPMATVKNYGTDTQTFTVQMTITGGYTDVQTVTTLAGGATEQVTFVNWTATTGAYVVNVCTQLGADEDPANDCETQNLYVWDDSGAWTSGANYPQNVYLGSGQGYSNGSVNKLYSIAGITASGLETECYEYDVPTDTWTALAPLPAGRDRHATALVGDFVYQIGGYDPPNVIQSTAYKYDIGLDTWTPIAPLPTPIGWNKAVGHGNYIYHAGGYDGTNILADVYYYDTLTDIWATATSMPGQRFGGAFSIVGNQLIYVGGASDGPISDAVFVGTITAPGVISWVTADNPFPYVGKNSVSGSIGNLNKLPTSETTFTKGMLAETAYPPGGMYRFDAAPWGSDAIIVAGGSPSGSWVAEDPNPCYVYEPATDTWTAQENVLKPVTAATSGSVHDGSTWKLIMTGGIDEVGVLGDTTQIYTQTLGGTTFALSVSVADGWNMVSIPGLHPTNQNVTTWWSNLVGNVFKFDAGYVSVTTAETGEGYWMNNSGAETYNYAAINIVTHDPIPVVAGWNMIGGYENIAPVSSLIPSAGTILSVFGYSNGYVTATDLVPGYGYWINVTDAGTITIPDPPLSKGSGEVVEYFKEDWGKIIITDNAGRSYTLYAVNGEVDLNNYELPPMPPVGMFDIRYGSGRIAEDINSTIQSIEMSGIEHPVRVRVENMSITLQDESGININAQLNPGEEITINNNSINKLLIISGEIGTPIEYALEQNYPNPFNPSTMIKFSVPEATNVTLTIYNTLGQRVTELVNTKLEAGWYSYQWDARNLATGMYIYELRTDKFVSIKKMMLLK